MGYGNVSERRREQPQVGVSVVILALEPHGVADARTPSASRVDAGVAKAATSPAKTGGATRSGASIQQPGSRETAASQHGCLWLPLVRRTRQPYLGAWALPGGSIHADETLEASAFTALASTTNLHPRYLEQLYTFSGPDRSRGGLPMVTVAYWAMVGAGKPEGLEARENVTWFPESALGDLDLAFDHRAIIDYALLRLRTKIEVPDIAARLIGDTFTLGQLHAVYEAITGQALDLANFRRKMLASGVLEDTGDKLRVGRQRPAAVYRYAKPDATAGGVNAPIASAMPWIDAVPTASDQTGTGSGMGNRNSGFGGGNRQPSGQNAALDDVLAALMPSR